MRDILDGLALAIEAFRGAGLDAPTVIMLGTHEDGMRFLSSVRQQDFWTACHNDMSLGKEIRGLDGSVYMQVQIMGLAVRWPANRFAMPDGSFRHV